MSDVAVETSQNRIRVLPLAFAAIGLTAFFMILRFPYDRLAVSIAQRIEQQTGSRVSLGPVSSALVRWAPGIEAEGVQIVRPDGTRVDLDRLGVRPAIALSWLRGDPALAVELESQRGDASGVVAFGDSPGFAGTLTDVDLEQMPQNGIGAPLHLTGRADADLDVTMREGVPEGDVEFEARDGMLTHPNLPIPMPFEKLSGEIELGGANYAQIEKLELASPLASGSASGTIGRAPAFASAPLKLEIQLTVSGAVQGSLRSQGVAIGNDGQVRVNVSGTPIRPIVR